MQVRAVVRDTLLLAYVDGVCYFNGIDESITKGSPGIALSGVPAGNGISHVSFGAIDKVVPGAVRAGSLQTSAFHNRVDLQWPAAVADANGTGVAWYQLYRDGVLIEDTTRTGFTDATVQPGTTYRYELESVNYHWSESSRVAVMVTTPTGRSTSKPHASGPGTEALPVAPALGFAGFDPRGVGIRPTGSYWGGAGEQIDVRSGNLNFTVPILKAMGRGGWSVGFNLNYNSQNWRQDPGGTWLLGEDVGYGFGWKLLAGSLTPVYSGQFTLDHYLFTDSTGAEYRLDQNNAGIWSSIESIYVWYDSNAQRLCFRDGSFWVLGCTSAGTEADSGTMYPTTMEDTNGNQILISYLAGRGVTGSNSSARLDMIEDVRAVQYQFTFLTYRFTYNSDPIPHLTRIYNSIGTAENWTTRYNESAPLNSPFDGSSFGATTQLAGLTQLPTNLTTTFLYDGQGSGEIVKMTTPYGGTLRWDYGTNTYSGSRSTRAVRNRFLAASAGAAEWQYILQIVLDGNGNPDWTIMSDTSVQASKAWWFQTVTTQPEYGLAYSFGENPQYYPISNGGRQFYYNWTSDPAGNLYIGTAVTREDQANPNQVQKKSTQVLDQYGNVTQVQEFDYGNLTTPARTYTNTYLTTDRAYTSRYIFNRLVSSKVSNGSQTTQLRLNTYDNYGRYFTDLPNAREHDAAYTTDFTTRGNVTLWTQVGAVGGSLYDIGGNATDSWNNGVASAATIPSANNYAAPTQISTNSLSQNLGWTRFLGLASTSGPNGDSMVVGYDGAARPSVTTSPLGAQTTYVYNDTASPPNYIAYTNAHWVKTTLDGFGRTIRAEKGDENGTQSVVDTIYAPCGCSPMGRVHQVSMPHAPGATPVWTTYNYDGIGRPASEVKPDGSTTWYAYWWVLVHITDAAGNWKQYIPDAFGNLVTVRQPKPNPAAGDPDPTYWTYYGYDYLDHLTTVTMPRDGVTQTRTFNYIDPATHAPGALLQSATNPENGTVRYTYNADATLASRVDAKGVRTQYSYVSVRRTQC